MTESFFAEITRFVGFGQEQQEVLARFRPLAEPHFVSIVDEFYVRLEAHEDARAVFVRPEQVKRLKISLGKWLARVLGGPWNEEYYELSSRIGRRHVEVRLPQRYMMTAMNVVRSELAKIARRVLADDPDECNAVLSAVHGVLDLELAIMLESYRDDYIAVVQRMEQVQQELLERRLEQSQTRFERVIETAGVLVIVLDEDSSIRFFNSHAESCTGYQRWEVIGRSLAELAGDGAASLGAAVQQMLSFVPPAPFVAPFQTRNDDELWIRWHVTSLPGEDGRSSVCAIGVDVSGERLLTERTRQAERLASLGTLAAGLAHEIRNPLNAAKLQLMLVERGLAKASDVPERASKASTLVRDELGRLEHLVTDFLAYARPRPVRLAGAELQRTISTVTELLQVDAAERSVSLGVDLEPQAALYDDEMVRQVLLNLVRNGIEAAQSEVVVTLRRRGADAVIEVIDDGAGPPDTDRLFEPFYTSKDEGTGLGLSIAHRMVTSHDGELTVSRRGDKTVFRFNLPLDGPSSNRT